jgi:transposase
VTYIPKYSLQILYSFPTSDSVLSISESRLIDKIVSLCQSRSDTWATERAQKLRDAEFRNPFQNNLFQSHIFNLQMLINIILRDR